MKRTIFRNLTPPRIAFACSLLFLILAVILRHYNTNRLAFASDDFQVQHVTNTENLPVALNIPAINAKFSVKQTRIKNGQWEIYPFGVSHLATSGTPNSNRNIIMYAHNTSDRFGNIFNLRKGDRIEIITVKGAIFTYVVEQTFEVNPSDMYVLQDSDQEELTLYTCSGFADLKRYIVKANLLKS